MRINRVTMAGFGPYRGEQTVDFDAFADDGIFLIGGKTGAGKSTILDAICFALYGSVPRYEGQTGAATKLRSDHCAPEDPSFVELEFTVGPDSYRLRRSPEYDRPKSRGDGFTTQKAEAELMVREGDSWVGLEAQLRTVGAKVAEIVQLSQEQFLQVILLAQNRFQEFLLAKSEERQALLRTLFGTRRFDDYDEALQERRKALESGVAGARTEISQLARQFAGVFPAEPGTPEAEVPAEPGEVVEWMGVRRDGERERLTTAESFVEQADAAWRAAQAEHTRLAELRRLQQRRAAAEARRDALREAAVELDALADRALADAGTHLGEQSSLEAAGAGLAELGGSLAAAADAEKRMPALDRAIAAADAKCEEADAALETAKQRAVDGKRELAELTPAIDAASAAASDQAAAQQRADSIAAVLKSLASAEEAERTLEVAQRRELESGQARTAASAALDALRAQRLDGHAAELARALSEGEPCPVCGSTHHPAKAVWNGRIVTESDLADAESALATAETEAARRSAEATDAKAKLAELQGAAAGHSVASAEAVKSDATVRLEAAKSASQRASELRSRRDAVSKLLANHDAELDRLRAACDTANTQRATAQAERAEAQKAVEAALAGHPTVAARIASVTASARVVRDVSQQRQRHATEVATVDATLAEEAVRSAPAEPVELEAAETALGQASRARDAALSARSTLAAHLTTAESLLVSARSTYERSAQLAARFEVVQRLANTVHGQSPNTMAMRLESFVLAAELEEIVLAANARLTQMSGGRYLLEHSDERAARGAQSGLGLAILDQHTGVPRPTQSLSGGETFLASLALALGLAEAVTARAGGITLDTLFIDEGFGSLDSETLEIAMGTLDSLRAGGRTIGLISHVEAMKEQIPAKLQVDVADGGWSVITQS
ncbi:AAA family ATPase [Gryllotalpicola protaetiae]|uniref:Nuclease SbcCD subunit C n=1 Tax=Gryllotalpicola protaetiae TaxID=2419771 RepID=A0A387BQ47_9MICO|nr:SMC family ATPase [Gryllotalpicola protaetiae]AYG03096.1 SMC family ATPase [Gryllotalpicola protaetiae]